MLDTRTGGVSFCNAGHNKPYVVRTEGAVEQIDGTRCLGLCLANDFEYASTEITLQPGDCLCLYTDGVTEAANSAREQFSEERLDACLHQNGHGPADIIRAVLRAVEAFAGGARQADDITMLALQYEG